MKKLFFLSMVLFAASGCVRDDGAGDGLRTKADADDVPHIYGMATLPDAPATRGVASTLRVWSKPAAKNITVKFLNGLESYQEYVKNVAAEWEKYADVKFVFVPDSVDAIVRIGFDLVRGMMSSWAYTGTDHMALYNRQDEPTIHYAQWRRAADVVKRSDVLRSFGQVLGLELEYRHPSCTPDWITQNGQIDEAAIRDYWEYELGGVISWQELKTFVLDPMADDIFLVKTKEYDENSVMNWPFCELIANGLPLIAYDNDRKSELSATDKEFIKQLYGEAPNEPKEEPEITNAKRTLVSFSNKASQVAFEITTTKDVSLIYSILVHDEPQEYVVADTTYHIAPNSNKDIGLKPHNPFEVKELVHITMPEGVDEYTTTVSYDFGEKTPLEFLQLVETIKSNEWNIPSTALQKFEMRMTDSITDLRVRSCNGALKSVRLEVNSPNAAHNFQFTDLAALEEFYLIQAGNSKVTLKNCPKLETFATSRTIWKPEEENIAPEAILIGAEAGNKYHFIQKGNMEFPPITYPDSMVITPPPYEPWPMCPELFHSLSDSDKKGLTIENCPNLKTVSLDHTRIKEIDFRNTGKIEYLYLSSEDSYIAGGGIVRHGEYLYNTIKTLPARLNTAPGMVVVRGMMRYPIALGPYYGPVKMNWGEVVKINKWLEDNNWSVVFERGYEDR